MKLRTILTSIGVMIGTAAIVAMISLSLGLKENAVKSLERFGNLTEMEVAPAFMMPDESAPIPRDQRKQLDSQAVRELKQIPGIDAVMPTKRLRAEAKIKVGRREGYVELIGVDVLESAEYKKNDIEKGTYLSGAPNEIVVTYELPRELRDVEKERREARNRNAGSRSGGPPMPPGRMGGGEQPAIDLVGKTATIVITREYRVDDELKLEKKEIRVRVVGQQQKLDNSRYGPAAFVPLSLVNELNEWAMRSMEQDDRFMGADRARDRSKAREQKGDTTFDEITVKVASREQVENVVKLVQEKGFEVYSPARALEEINNFFFIVQMILGGIAAVSLLVASIGIVNTMIMSILERTKEIGIMKVIGATVYNIRWLFLIESGFIGLIGGFTGLGLAYGAVELVNYVGGRSGAMDKLGFMAPGPEEAAAKLAVVPLWLALFAIGFAFLIGLLAGIFPAFRASRLSALQAIRSE
jgi:ABC-type antimicrobial peptide transport system permease subunit